LAINGSGQMYWTSAGSTPAWNDLNPPNADDTMDMAGNTTQWTWTENAADMFSIFATGTFGDVSVVVIDQNTGAATDGTMLEITTEASGVDHLMLAFDATPGGAPEDYVTHKIVDAGTYTIDVTSDGTAAVVITDGLTAGSLSTAGIIDTTNTTEVSAIGTAALTVDGGASIAKDLWVGGADITLISATAGSKITGGDGTITLYGTGSGTDEDMSIDLNTSNLITIASGSSATFAFTPSVLFTGGLTVGANTDIGSYSLTAASFIPDTAANATGEIGFTGGAFTLFNVDDALSFTNAANVWTVGSTGDTIAITPATTITGVLTTGTNIELGHASENTLSAASGVLSVENNEVITTASAAGKLADDSIVDADIDQDGTFALTGAWTMATVDATTDFTVDGLVISADDITNDNALAITSTSGAVTVESVVFTGTVISGVTEITATAADNPYLLLDDDDDMDVYLINDDVGAELEFSTDSSVGSNNMATLSETGTFTTTAGVTVGTLLALTPQSLEVTTEADISLTGSMLLLTGDNDGDNDAIDLQNGTVAGQTLVIVGVALIDGDDTITVNMADTTCTGCLTVLLDEIGDTWTLVWTGSTWATTANSEVP